MRSRAGSRLGVGRCQEGRVSAKLRNRGGSRQKPKKKFLWSGLADGSRLDLDGGLHHTKSRGLSAEIIRDLPRYPLKSRKKISYCAYSRGNAPAGDRSRRREAGAAFELFSSGEDLIDLSLSASRFTPVLTEFSR